MARRSRNASKPRNRLRLSPAPMALASDGSVLVNVAYVEDLTSVEEVGELLRNGRIAGPVFVGVVLDSTATKAALKRIDDAAGEIAATSGLRVRRERGQR